MALFIGNFNNTTIKNCIFYGGIQGKVSYDEYVLNGYKNANGVNITNCIFDIDWHRINENNIQQMESDILHFVGYDDITIDSNTIKFIDVNRVLKTTQVTNESGTVDYSIYEGGAWNITLSNNTIEGTCSKIEHNPDSPTSNSYYENGKQIFDMFNGSMNVAIKENKIKVKGFSEVFQNKTSINVDRNGNTINGLFSYFINIENNSLDFDGNGISINILDENGMVCVNNNAIKMVEKNSIPTDLFPIKISDVHIISICDNSISAISSGVPDISFKTYERDAGFRGSIENVYIQGNTFDSQTTIIYINNPIDISDFKTIDNYITNQRLFIENLSNGINTISLSEARLNASRYLKNTTNTNTNGLIKKLVINISDSNPLSKNVYQTDPIVRESGTAVSGIEKVESNIPIALTNETYGYYSIVSEYGNSNTRIAMKPIKYMQSYYDSDIGRVAYWYGGKWVDENGYTFARNSGTTSERPDGVLRSADKGFMFFDETLGYPIYAKEIASTSPYTVTWVDATGSVVS